MDSSASDPFLQVTLLTGNSNTFQISPIARLSEDLLHYLFTFLAGPVVVSEEDSPVKRFPLLAASQVCCFWRRLTLASPRLWRRVCILWPQWPTKSATLLEFLNRSDGMPLLVNLTGGTLAQHSPDGLQRMSESMRTLSEQTYRFEELLVIHLPHAVMYSIMDQFRLPALRLQRLGLPGYGVVCREDLTHTRLFSGQMPLLRDVYVNATSAVWLACKNLTTLYIHQYVLSTVAILRTLHNCPTLEVLSLFFQISREDAVWAPPTVELPRLRQLEVYCPLARMMYILARLSFPTTANVSFRFNPYVPPMDSLRACATLCEIASTIEVVTLCLRVQGGENPIWHASLASENRFEIDVTYQADYYCAQYRRTRHYTGFGALEFLAVKHLNIDMSEYELHLNQWPRILRTIPTVVSMDVYARDDLVMSLFEALNHTVHPEADLQMSDDLCPNLTNFTLRLDASAVAEDVIYDMVDCFRDRAYMGHPLDTCKIVMPPGQICPPFHRYELEHFVLDKVIIVQD